MVVLNQLAHYIGVSSNSSQVVHGMRCDSRKIQAGELFIAIPGMHFDGHDFILHAEQQGAIAIICEHKHDQCSILQWVVPSSVQALGQLATCFRDALTCPCIAVTGSNGKTTVKDMIASILPQPAYATVGNFNNQIGVPLCLAEVQAAAKYAVFELGASRVGDIAYTVAMVKPNVALINNIAPAHIGQFESIENIVREKSEIYHGLAADGIAIINADDKYADYWNTVCFDKQILRFSLNKQVDFYAQNCICDISGVFKFDLITPTGMLPVQLQIPGEHSICNALAAAACCSAVGIDLATIASGLMQFTGVKGRMMGYLGKKDAWIIDDTYNANLASVLTAIDVLAKRPGKTIFVLGDMGELGTYAQEHHAAVGYAAKQMGIDMMMTMGTYSVYTTKAFGKCAQHYDNDLTLRHDLLNILNKDTTVLFKGSRSAGMERFVKELVG